MQHPSVLSVSLEAGRLVCTKFTPLRIGTFNAVSPFPFVSLPCILYRLNGLLLAEKLRCTVATEISLGKLNLDPGQLFESVRRVLEMLYNFVKQISGGRLYASVGNVKRQQRRLLFLLP